MACEIYTPTIWVNGTAPAINASNLNNIEGGIKRVADCTVNLEERIETIEQSDVPIGMIVMWSGLEIPTGWVLCDGVHPDAPNLVGKFIRAGNLGTTGTTGGSDDVVVVEHAHTGTALNNGIHRHNTAASNSIAGGTLSVENLHTTGTGTVPTSDNGLHGHELLINDTGVSGVDKNIPAYYTLMYIMKVS